MVLRIAPNKTISEVLKDFNAVFPYLKMEFFSNKAYEKQDFSPASIIPHSRKLAECQASINKDEELEISEGMKVMELEKELKEKYGLNALVFRRSGNLWLQTTMTDHWSLQKQNQHGKELSFTTTIRPLINNEGGEDAAY
jgi:hypothetical protein